MRRARPHRTPWLPAAAVALGLAAGMAPAGADTPPPLQLGIYSGGHSGLGGGAADDDSAKVVAALDRLQAGPGFLVREYVRYDGISTAADDAAPYLRYLGNGRRMDLVLQYPGHGASLAGWVRYVRNEVRFAGPRCASISIGLDVNSQAATDPSVLPAIVAGLRAAHDEAARQPTGRPSIGFDEISRERADTAFWQSLAAAAGPRLRDCLDYVGVEIYPDVFFGLPFARGTQIVAGLAAVRFQEMPIAGLPADIPIHVAENGWDTLPPRSEAEQVDALRAELTAVNDNRGPLGVTTYEYFALRDTDTGSPNLLHHFGLLRTDYTPKPAFFAYRDLVRAIGRP
jgi:hypothetical protein